MEDTGVDRKMILKWILKEEDGECVDLIRIA